MNCKKQHGAVMLETAYVLPIMLGVMLFLIELVGFAMNSFAANDVLTDVHTSILSEVATVSNLAPGATLPTTVKYASCSGSKVVLPTGTNAALTTLVKDALVAKQVTFVSGQPVTAKISASTISGFDVYVINFTGVANTLVLPTFFEKFLPINVDTIVSIKDSCTS